MMTLKTGKLFYVLIFLITSLSFCKTLNKSAKTSPFVEAEYSHSKLYEQVTFIYDLSDDYWRNSDNETLLQVNCESPTGINISNITQSSVDISWNASPSEVNSYEWVLMVAGDNPDTASAFASGTLTSGTTNTSMTNLNDDTAYDFYIRTLCDNSNISNWSIVKSFTTLIGPAQINLLLYTKQAFDSGDSEADALGINFKPNGNNAVDQFDAGKLGNLDENLARLNNGSFISIENRSMPADNESLTLNVWNYTTTDYVFIAQVFNLPQDIDAYIVDDYTGDYHKIINGTNQVDFSVNSSIPGTEVINRFSIDFDEHTCAASTVWSGNSWNNGLPDASTKALFTGDFTETGTLETCDLEVKTEAQLNVKGVLKLNGIVSNLGQIVFKSDVNGSGQIDQLPASAVLDDNITVERFIPVATEDTRAFRFLSSAVDSNEPIFNNWQESGNSPAGIGTHITGDINGNNGFDPTASGNPSMFTFDNSFTGNQNDAWNAIPNTDNTYLEAGKAYRIFIRGDRNYDLNSNPADAPNTDVTLRAKGTMLTGDQTFSLSQLQDYYSLVGNPYQTIVNINDVQSTNMNTNYYWVWDPNMSDRGAYVAVDLSTGNSQTPGGSASGSMANQFVMPGQSFLVQTINNGAAHITFTEAAKDVSATPTAVFSDDELASINLKLYKTTDLNNDELESDALQINFNDQFANAVTIEDADKLGNPDENLARLNNGEFLSIEKRAMPVDGESLAIFTNGYTANDYTFKATLNQLPSDINAYLIDTYTGDQTLLNAGENQISFNVDQNIPASIALDRFSLEFDLDTFGVEDQELSNQLKIYPNPVDGEVISIQTSNMKGEVDFKLYNVAGQIVYESAEVFDTRRQLKLNIGQHQSGVYFLEVTNDGQSAKKKIIIK